MKKIREIFESVFENLGLVMAPITAAVMTGLSIQHFFSEVIGPYLAGVIGFVFAFAIEATGYMSFVAFQKDRDIKKPVGYLVSVIAVVTIIELFVYQDYQRWGIGLSGVAIAGIMYWSYSASNATLSEVNELKQLAELGYKKNKNGELVPISKRSKINSNNNSKNSSNSDSKKLRWNTMSPEVKQDIYDLTYSAFCSKYQSIFEAVSESSFYHWQKRIDSEKSLNGAG